LSLLVGVSGERIGERHGRVFRQSGLAPIERCSDSGGEGAALEREGFSEDPDIKEVLHAAVADAARDHRFEFFSDHGFRRIGFDAGRLEVEQGRIDDLDGGRCNGVAKADIDLQRQTGFASVAVSVTRTPR